MPRRTIPHPDCQPYVNRHCGAIRVAMPVLRPDGEHDLLMREITPKQALAMAAELLAGASAAMGQAGHKEGDNSPGTLFSCELRLGY